MFDLIVYSNSSYREVLEIQTDHLIGNFKKILFIDKNGFDLTNVYSKYDEIYFYNDSDVYAKRVHDCLKNIKSEFFLFIHDIDIIIFQNQNHIVKLFDFMTKEYIDRIDLKYTDRLNTNKIYSIEFEDNDLKYHNVQEVDNSDSKYFLIKQNDINNYIYNVNPSIWRKEVFQNILENFISKTYRTIEDLTVQNFTKQFNIYKIHSKTKKLCGYFECVDFFIFLHISHTGKFLPLNSTFTSYYGQSYIDVKEEYIKNKIIQKLFRNTELLLNFIPISKYPIKIITILLYQWNAYL